VGAEIAGPLEHKGLPVLSFASSAAWEAWLAEHGAAAAGIWLRLAKKGTRGPSVTKADAIEAALSHGWIDGQLDRWDEHHWLVRFTRRGARSAWSQINRDAAEKLIAGGRMRPAGLAEVERARADGRWDAAYAPQSRAEVPRDLAAALAAEPESLAFFETLRGASRYAVLYRISEAKRPATRAARIAKFVAMLARGETIHG
jgi:uncharacterized protein YdeI (YjbR/CyaY-like superfamily)